jgi:hypothetical protein
VTGRWNWIKTYPSGNPASYPYYPLTPVNTGLNEILSFDANGQFSHTINDTLIQSGTYKTGHGTYLPYAGGHPYSFDSVSYFVNGSKVNVDYYSILHNDTLVFSGSFAGIIGGGSKYFVE